MHMKSRQKRESCRKLRLRLRKFFESIAIFLVLMFQRTPRPRGVALGRYVKGARGLWVGRNREAVLSLDQLRRHALMLGGTPEAKNLMTSLFVDGVAREDRKSQLFFFDNEANTEMAELFDKTAGKTKRKRLLFPERPFNAWTGRRQSIFQRLLRALGFSHGSASHAEMATAVLDLAFRLYNEPPRSHKELLKRLNYKTLYAAFGEQALRGIDSLQVDEVRLRCKAFFAYLGTALDGEESFWDLDAAYFSVDPMALGEGAEAIMQILLAQFIDYAKYEKAPGRFCAVFLRVTPALASYRDLPLLLELARELGVIVILILQTVADAGGTTQMERLLRCTGTQIVHRDQVWPELETASHSAESVDVMSMIDLAPERALWRPSRIRREDLSEMPVEQLLVISNGEGTLVDVPQLASP